MNAIIQVRELAKSYLVRERRGFFSFQNRRVHALTGVSFEVQQGEFFGLLGRNGAGKTTLLKCLTTLISPSSGSARVNGFDVGAQAAQVRASLGCMLAGERGLYWKLTGRENLAYFAALHGLRGARQRRAIERVSARLGLEEHLDRAVETYSSGQRMKVAVARALVHEAPILVLDEPTNALDVHAARDLRLLLAELCREGRTVLFSSHVLSEAEQLCDRVAIVDRGKIVAIDTPARLAGDQQQLGVLRLRGQFSERGVQAVRELPLVRRVRLDTSERGTVLSIASDNVQAAAGPVISALVALGSTVEDVELSAAKLEQAFLELTIEPDSSFEQRANASRLES